MSILRIAPIVGSLSVLVGLAGCSAMPVMSPIQTGSVTRPAAGAVEETVKGGTHVSVGKAARVHTLVSFDKNCNPLEPVITVDKQPAKGTIGFEKGKPTMVQYSSSGNCIGKTIAGTVVTYTAKAGATGSDVFAITAKSRSGETAAKTIKVVIVE